MNLINFEQWVSDPKRLAVVPGEEFLTWYLMPTSITDYAKLCGYVPQLRLIRYEWVDGELMREIEMYIDNQPFWYALTEIPKQTYLKRQAAFDTLDTTPIGNMLYNDSAISRSAFEFSLYDNYYARRSQFYIDTSPLTLTEVFYPVMLAL